MNDLLTALFNAHGVIRDMAELDPCPGCGATTGVGDPDDTDADEDHADDCPVDTWLRLHGETARQFTPDLITHSRPREATTPTPTPRS